jgi:uncharacterized membrane protein (UPF0127 family)
MFNIKHSMQYLPSRKPVLLLILLASLTGCDSSPGNLPITKMQIGGRTFKLEIATTPHDQEVGLMHRDNLPDGHGMIFVFTEPQTQAFWNHDVHFGLDLIFMDGNGDVVSLKHLEPYNDKLVYSDFPYYYTIELNDGVVAKLGIKVHDHLDIPTEAQSRPSDR